MPYIVKSRGNEQCVYKEGDDGEPTGEPLGCHATRQEAVSQMRALYAAEPELRSVKLVGEDGIEGLGMPFGGPFNGQDLDGERFTEKTDFAFDWFAERPLLYQHGLDDPGISVVGRVKSWELRADLGVWVQAQLDKSHEYFGAVKELIKKGKLFFSSGAMRHLVETNSKTGEIKRWPWVELSLTPTPSNMLAQVEMAAAKSHFEMAGLKTDAAAWDMDTEGKAAITATKPGFEETEKQIRYRVNDPGGYQEGSFRTMPVQGVDGVQFIVGRPKGKTTMEVQSVHFDKEKFTMAEAHAWIEGHKDLQAGKSADEPEEKAVLVSTLIIADATDLEKIPFTKHADLVADFAASLTERTKDLNERRLKEGRVLSAASKKRLAASMDAMASAIDELRAFLDDTMPEAKAEVSERQKRQLEILKLYQIETGV